MARRPAARRRAEDYRKRAVKAINKHRVFGRVDVVRAVERTAELWKAYTPRGLPAQMGLPGEWTITMSWVVATDPEPTGEPQLVESAISLNLSSDLTSNRPRSLVRYDIDHRALTSPTHKYSPAHLNVLQPGLLEDNVHYPIVGLPLQEWPVEAVVDFLFSDELRADLDGRV